MSQKKEELKQKINKILEETVERKEQYKEERKAIYDMLEKAQNKEDIEILESVSNMFTKMVALEKECEKYRKIKIEFQEVLKQRIRKQDAKKQDENNLNLFAIQDKSGKNYTFILRENAKKYRENHPELFGQETPIKIVRNENVDLEDLFLEIIEKRS